MRTNTEDADSSVGVTQKTTGIRSVLSLAPAYQLVQRAVGADRYRRTIADEVLMPSERDRVLDVGCGTADILEYLPEDVEYFGFDPNPSYVRSARRKFGSRGTFSSASVGGELEESGPFDVVMAIGVLHHLDDADTRRVFEMARQRLLPGGRFVSVDPTLVDEQPRIARFLIEQDRGQHVRSPRQLANLIEPVFSNAVVTVRHDLLRVPYSHVLVTAQQPRE